VYAKGMEQRSSVALRMDVPIKSKKEVYASNMEQTVAHLKVVIKLRRGKRIRGQKKAMKAKSCSSTHDDDSDDDDNTPLSALRKD
jgi:hypothetical protein